MAAALRNITVGIALAILVVDLVVDLVMDKVSARPLNALENGDATNFGPHWLIRKARSSGVRFHLWFLLQNL